MKVALVHDYIKEYGGAERVLESLHELFPTAPVYTSVYLPEYLGPHREKFKDWDIRTSWANSLPFRQKLISPLRIISPLLFRSFDFSGYDLIISSATGAYFPNALRKKDATLICYCHTPPRYLYGYQTARIVTNPLLQSLIALMNHVLRMVDFAASKNVDQYIANSEEVKKRIQKFYRKDAVVVYPPVVTNNQQRTTNNKREYYVTGGRLARAKHNELPIKACLELGVPLKVFGRGFAGYENELRSLVKSHQSEVGRKQNPSDPQPSTLVHFVGEVSDEEKFELMIGAKALLYASEDEDFGIIPVEAMACGTPVIAYRSGGVQETVVVGKTGLFYDDLTVSSLVKAIHQLEKLQLKEKDCLTQAANFSEDCFKTAIKKSIETYSS